MSFWPLHTSYLTFWYDWYFPVYRLLISHGIVPGPLLLPLPLISVSVFYFQGLLNLQVNVTFRLWLSWGSHSLLPLQNASQAFCTLPWVLQPDDRSATSTRSLWHPFWALKKLQKMIFAPCQWFDLADLSGKEFRDKKVRNKRRNPNILTLLEAWPQCLVKPNTKYLV